MNDIERLSAALIDRYRIDRQIGAGGMASVYLAHDLRHQRAVAIKVLRQDIGTAVGAERFLREIRIAANLAHPHILPLHDSGNVQEVLYYVMPFVQGESLRERLTREQQLPFDEALQLTHEVADALAYAHRRGVVHRDVKPENILLSDGHAFVADFGIARALSAQGERLTNSGLAIGTPAYMSPEQASGAIEPDARTDVYSLGCVLYEMLGGVPPFTGPNPQTVLARKMLDPVPSLRTLRDSVPLHVERAIARALAKSPADRFTSTTEFAEALREKTDEGVARGDSQWGRFLTFGVPSLAILGTALVLSTTDWHPSASAKGSLSHRQITFTGQARWPTISPDGQFIAYVEGELGTRGRLLVQDLAGGDPVTVLDSVRVGIAPRWGHAEHGILVPAWSLGERGRGGLYAVPRLGGQPRKLADGRISGFGYDADGETLLTIVQNRDCSEPQLDETVWEA